MQQAVWDHYRSFGLFTFPGKYQEDLQKNLPDDIREIGKLVRGSLVHRTSLIEGNQLENTDLRFGDMTRMPWYRQPEDDVLTTASAMLAELYRRDPRGIVADRAVENKLVVTCRYVAILMASILKAKGIPARVRAGHAPYFSFCHQMNISCDHWLNEYWHEKEKRWVIIDVDGSLSLAEDFDPYDMPAGKFDFPAPAWLGLRKQTIDPLRFWNAKPERGALVLLWSFFYDFHCLMNQEILYIHGPLFGSSVQLANLLPEKLKKIDDLAILLCEPEKNFAALKDIWENDKEFRILYGGLL
ncbi:MAG: transglutaminase domain-containing protein [Candidatus Abawacabacteria bacterium]|nr:transglutaminase domain-containing protein [Candidatus Abawacabacteria bacterium]